MAKEQDHGNEGIKMCLTTHPKITFRSTYSFKTKFYTFLSVKVASFLLTWS